MSDDDRGLFARLGDDELVDRYRRSMPPGEGVTSGKQTALEAEMQRRGILPDREKAIPEKPPHEIGRPNGPVEAIPPGDDAADTDNGPGKGPG